MKEMKELLSFARKFVNLKKINFSNGIILYRGYCPFCCGQDQFSIDKKNQTFNCFKCGLNGDVAVFEKNMSGNRDYESWHFLNQKKLRYVDYEFVLKVGKYIYAQNKRRATQRKLLKHFSNKRLKDLNNIVEYLNYNYNIFQRRGGYRNKTITYQVIK